MFHRSLFRVCALVAGLSLAAGSVAVIAQQDSPRRVRKYKTPPPAARIVVTVLRDYNGKPVSQAHVIFHPIEGDRDKGSMELKTNDDGEAMVDVIPIGDLVRLHVFANGFQTFGEDFKIDKPEIRIEVRLKRPGAQYSVYNKTGAQAGTGKPAEAGSGSATGKAAPSEADKQESQPK